MSEPIRYAAPPSDTVRAIQYALERHGIPLPRSQTPEGPDGRPGPETWAAVDAWCLASGVEWDAQSGVIFPDLADRIVASAPQIAAPKKTKKGG